jgi:hypothetical protein
MGEAVEIGAEDVALEGEVGELALPFDADETGVLEFFHVVGKGGGADGLGFAETGTGRGALAAADLGEDVVAARCCEGAGDERELAVGEVGPLRGNVGPLRGESGFLCRAATLFCHEFLPYPRGAVLPGKFHITPVDIHAALTYRQDMSSSLRVAAQCCRSLLRRVRLEPDQCLS